MNKEKKISAFNPNNPATDDTNIFGLPFNEEESDLILLPIPWEVTVSYRTGTAKGPDAIFDASKQVDLYDAIYPGGWKHGIHYKTPDAAIRRDSKKYRVIVDEYLNKLTTGKLKKKDEEKALKTINKAGGELKEQVKKLALSYLNTGKLVGLVGGDHSTPLGFIEALAEKHGSIGILQLDAHCDLRNGYEGFTYSHASIMYNALQVKGIDKLVQVGIRDYCNEEVELIEKDKRVSVFFDKDLKASKYEGETWQHVCKRIVAFLPDKVYVSFDIDGLDPKLCSNTGTPVPGGLEFEEAVYLINAVAESGKQIVGFDLNEVAPGKDEWDANVGARMLYKLCNILLKSNFKK